MQKNEIKAWMDLHKLLIQAAIGFLIAILLQNIFGKPVVLEISIAASLYLIILAVWLSIRYIRLARQLDKLEE